MYQLTYGPRHPDVPAPPEPRYRAVGPRVITTRYGLGGRVPYDVVVAETPDFYGAVALAKWLNESASPVPPPVRRLYPYRTR